MCFIKQIRVGEEGVAAGFGAEIKSPAAIFHGWKIAWVGVAEDPSAEGDKAGGSDLKNFRLDFHSLYCTSEIKTSYAPSETCFGFSLCGFPLLENNPCNVFSFKSLTREKSSVRCSSE